MPPFSTKKHKKGAGFKDAVIWESILNADKLYKYRPAKFIVFTNDRDFQPEILEKEFKKDYYRQRINIEFFISENWNILSKELDDLFFELFTNANVYEPDLINVLKFKFGKNIEIIKTRTKIKHSKEEALVEITSKIKKEGKIKNAIVTYDFLNKNIL